MSIHTFFSSTQSGHDEDDLPLDSGDPDSDSESENELEQHVQHTSLGQALLTTNEIDSRELLLQPNQPRLKSFPSKQFGKKKIEYRSFNSKWFDNDKWSTWLHWDSETEKAYCFMCQNIYLLNWL